MDRRIVDLPLPRVVQVDWDIDWREQSAGTMLGGRRGILLGGLPRWIGTLPQILRASDILGYRAARWYARGMTGVFRVAMVDPLAAVPVAGTVPFGDGASFAGGAEWYDESVIPAVAAAQAGDEQIVVDETDAPHPVRVGQIMSHEDRPFAVVWRSGSGSEVTLGVEMPLRAPIPAGSAIHFRGRGLFEMVEPRSGNPAYGLSRIAQPVLMLQEWLR